MKKIFFVVLLCCFQTSYVFAQKTNKNKSGFENTKISFDKSAIDAIYLHPNEILNNVDSFWTSNPAYKMVGKWATHNGYKLSEYKKKFKVKLTQIAKLPITESANHKTFFLANKIMDNQNRFMDMAIPYIYSYLPSNTPPVTKTIYFTDITSPWAFAMNKGIGIQPGSSHFNGDTCKILNLLLHEVFHSCYYYTARRCTELNFENSTQNKLVYDLVNEGMATYVAYKAQYIFPNKTEEDYVMLENDNEVKRQINNVNRIFSNFGTISKDSLLKFYWQVGIIERAYYVTGSYMAKTIEDSLGKDSLINAISIGPRYFIHKYNSLINDERKIVEFPLPSKISIA